jgi:polysaccharide biosynthesis protein PslG
MSLLTVLRRGAVLAALAATLSPSTGFASPDPGGDQNATVPIPAPDGRLFGFNTQAFLRGMAPSQEVSLAKQLGSQVQRFGVSWHNIQLNATDPPLGVPGNSALANVAAMYDALLAQQPPMKPIMVISGAPDWAGPPPSDPSKPWSRHPDAAHVDEYRDFVAALAARFPAAVIEPWNEPNLIPFWDPAPDPALMASMQCAAYHAVKALPSPNTVISPGFWFGTAPSGTPYTSYVGSMYADPANGLKGCMDALNVHPYPGQTIQLGANTSFANKWEEVRNLRALYADTSPIWVTEVGTFSELTGFTEVSQCRANKFLYNKLMTMADVRMVLFHTLVEKVNSSQQGKDTYGFFKLVNNTQTLKPVGLEFKAKATGAPDTC